MIIVVNAMKKKIFRKKNLLWLKEQKLTTKTDKRCVEMVIEKMTRSTEIANNLIQIICKTENSQTIRIEF